MRWLLIFSLLSLGACSTSPEEGSNQQEGELMSQAADTLKTDEKPDQTFLDAVDELQDTDEDAGKVDQSEESSRPNESNRTGTIGIGRYPTDGDGLGNGEGIDLSGLSTSSGTSSQSGAGAGRPGVSVTDVSSGDFAGNGFKGRIEGYSLVRSQSPPPLDTSLTGKVQFDLCLRQDGSIRSITPNGKGTTTNSYLTTIATRNLRKFRFSPAGNQGGIGCGWIEFEFKSP